MLREQHMMHSNRQRKVNENAGRVSWSTSDIIFILSPVNPLTIRVESNQAEQSLISESRDHTWDKRAICQPSFAGLKT